MVYCFVFFCPRISERNGLYTHLTVSFKAFSLFTFLEIWAQNFSFWMKAFLLAHPFRNISRCILWTVNHCHRHPVWLSWLKQTKHSGKGRKTRKTRNDRGQDCRRKRRKCWKWTDVIDVRGQHKWSQSVGIGLKDLIQSHDANVVKWNGYVWQNLTGYRSVAIHYLKPDTAITHKRFVSTSLWFLCWSITIYEDT